MESSTNPLNQAAYTICGKKAVFTCTALRARARAHWRIGARAHPVVAEQCFGPSARDPPKVIRAPRPLNVRANEFKRKRRRVTCEPGFATRHKV